MTSPAPHPLSPPPAPPGAEPPRFLVPVDGRPECLALLPAVARLAKGQGAPWLVAHVESPARLHYSPREEARLQEQLSLAERLGAEVAQVQPSGLRVARDILALARERGATCLVLPAAVRPGRAVRWRADPLRDLLAIASGLEIRLLPGEPAASRPWLLPREPARPRLRRLATALVAVALATVAGLAIYSHLSLADVAMLYVLCITVVATRYGHEPGFLTAVLSVLALDYFFIPSRFTFGVRDLRYLGTFAVMLGVGWVVANLAERIRAQTRLALERERRTGALYRLGAALAEGGDAPAIQARVEDFLRRELSMPALVLLADRDGILAPRAAAGLDLDRDELGTAQWALANRAPAGRGTAVLPGARALFLPLAGAEAPVGVLALVQDPAAPANGGDPRALPLALAAQISLALERARLAEERAEARLHAEQEQLRSTLLSSLSHDLRTPLGTITGASSTLLEPGPEAAPGDQRMLLQTIHQESRRLERLVNNLLELTKLESGQVQARKEWVPMEEVVGAAVGRLEDQLADRQLVLRLRETWVPLDPVLLEQVLLNLLDNALKFSPAGSPIEVECWVEDGAARLRIGDRGPGFAPGEEERVFQKLYRGSRAGSTPGAGLGLAICRAVAQAHGGTIDAANRPGGGGQITLTLPVEGAPPQLPPEGPYPDAPTP